MSIYHSHFIRMVTIKESDWREGRTKMWTECVASPSIHPSEAMWKSNSLLFTNVNSSICFHFHLLFTLTQYWMIQLTPVWYKIHLTYLRCNDAWLHDLWMISADFSAWTFDVFFLSFHLPFRHSFFSAHT